MLLHFIDPQAVIRACNECDDRRWESKGECKCGTTATFEPESQWEQVESVREMLQWMQTNQPKPESYSREAICTRPYHTAVSLLTEREVPDEEEATHRTTKVHVRRKAEGRVLSHFTVQVETRVWRRPITAPRARIDHPLWTLPTLSGLVTVDLSEGDKLVLDFADPVWERAGR
eukprot:2342123-Rhodomonas_salina.1